MIYCIGETTYDIVFKNNKPVDGIVGGSQLNTAVSLGRLGAAVSLVSQVSSDQLGQHCIRFVQQNGVSTEHISQYNQPMRLAIAFLDEHNDASYSFYKPTNQAGFQFPQAQAGDLVLFGSSFSYRPDLRTTLLDFLREARQNGAVILFDPNCRKPIDRTSIAYTFFQENAALAHIVKGSDEDFRNLGAPDFNAAAALVGAVSQAQLAYTMGSKGVHIHCHTDQLQFTVPQIDAISTIGAGDTFSAGLLYGFLQLGTVPHKLPQAPNWHYLVSMATTLAQTVCMSMENYIPTAFKL